MFVVVVGSREWRAETGEKQVFALLDDLRQRYSGMVVVTSSSDKGVGNMVKDYCLRDKTTFQLIDMNIRVFASLPRLKLAQAYAARNEALVNLGEEFHVFVDANRKGAFEDLIEKVTRAELVRPLYVHEPDWAKIAEKKI